MEKERKISLTTYVVTLIIMAFILIVIIACMIGDANNSKKQTDEVSMQNGTETASDVGETLGTVDELVLTLRDKFDFNKMTVLADVYENEGKTSEDFSNEFKLLLGWNKIEAEIIEKGFDERVTDLGTENAKLTITQEEMEESIKAIFGEDVEYTDATFENIENEVFWAHRNTSGTVNYANGVYTASFVEGGGTEYPYIEETVTKAIKYSDRVEIYVRTGFYSSKMANSVAPDEDIYDVEDGEEYNIAVYSSIDMKNIAGVIIYDGNGNYYYGVMEEQGAEMGTEEELLAELNTYKYTFKVDSTGEYYFAGIELVK